MKILIFNWRDITHSWSGGSEKYIHELAKAWVKLGHNVHLICGGYPGAIPFERIDGVHIRRLGSTYSIYVLLPFYYLWRLRWERFDIIIDVANGIPFFSVCFSLRPKILVIHHDHRLPWQREWSPAVARVGIWIEHKLVPQLYKNIRVVTLAHKTKNLLTQSGFKNVFVIPPGSEKNYFLLNPKKTPHPTILYLGRLRKHKRVALLLNIFKSMLPKVRGLKLRISGTGQDASRIRQIIASTKLANYVELMGYISEKEKAQVLASSWVLAFPSEVEGWGLVALEAAASGTPAVGFNVPGISEAIKHGQSGFIAGNVHDFKAALLKILTDKNLRSRFKKNSRIWASNFSWEKSAKAFLSILPSVSPAQSFNQNYYASFWRGASRRSFHPTYDIRANFITKYLQPKNVLDVGCGTGLLVKLLRERGVKANGVDISRDAVDQALSVVRPFIIQGNIVSLTASDKSYDTVTCVDVLEHIQKQDAVQAMKDCARVAKAFVYFDITCLEDIFFIHTDSTHVTKLFSWQWRRILESTLGSNWHISRPYILPLIHHGTFVAKRHSLDTRRNSSSKA